jgi:KDEL-tailed cysteine endopeptidase
MRVAILSVVACLACRAIAEDAFPPNYQILWSNFKEQYPKVYAVGEEDRRFEIFKANVDIIYAENAKGHSHKLAVTEFADLTKEEFKSMYLGYNPSLRVKSGLKAEPFPNISGTAPDAVDWVEKGGVTAVKNQQQCGSCWAFSTTGSVEGAYFVASGTLKSLSEEELVQCDNNGDNGCKGGLMDNAFEWIQENGGLCTEDAYPYTSGSGIRGTCKKQCSPVVTITGHVDVPSKDEDSLKAAVAKQPVSVAIEADHSVFQLYKGGVLESLGCGTQLDHGVLVVGYGTDGGKDYWKVKNSWGPAWGEEGYIRLARGKNMCGIAQQPSYPTGAKAAAPGPSPGPSPPAPPSPPSPPSPSTTHYEDPKDGCQSDEVNIQIQGVTGSVCAPSCSLFKPCPTDVPSGVTVKPQCALQDSSTHKKYCALICTPQSEDDQCGENASCKSVQVGIGVCTYDDGKQLEGSVGVELKMEMGEPVVV